MNTNVEYRRHGYQPPERPAAQPEAEASELARHRDPSLAALSGTGSIPQTHIAWIRPTEVTSYAAPAVGRGIDLHAELVRRARRAPITVSRVVCRPAPATPPPATNRTEGLQL